MILVVDDHPSVRASTSRLLSAHGYTVFGAESAAMAVQRATELRPDAILMDLHMPDQSGIDGAREIKQLDELKNIPIIGISATPPDWVHTCGLFASVLYKPCSSADLLAAIAAARGCDTHTT